MTAVTTPRDAPPVHELWGGSDSHRTHVTLVSVLSVTKPSHVTKIFSSRAVEQWSSGAVEQWSSGAVEQWSSGAVEQWSSGAVEQWSSG